MLRWPHCGIVWHTYNGWLLLGFIWDLLTNDCVSATSDSKENVVTRLIGITLFHVILLVLTLYSFEKQELIYQHGFTKVRFLPHHHHFPSFSSDPELVVRLSEDLSRKEPYRVNLDPQLRFSSSLVAETRILTFYTKIFGCPIHKMAGYSQKIEVEASMLLSPETSQTRFMCNTRCGNKAKGCGICCVRVRPSMLQVHQPKCRPMLCQHLRKLYQMRVGFLAKLPSGGLGNWKRPVSIMLKLGRDLSSF